MQSQTFSKQHSTMLETRRKLLNAALSGNMVLSCALLLTTMFLLETPYVGFDAAITAGVYVVFTFVAIVILNKSPSAFSIGFLVGASLLVLVLAFQGAFYWGLEAHNNPRRKTAAYLASGFHAVIFTVQCVVTTVVVKSKEDVIDTYAAYEYIPDTSYPDNAILANMASPINYQATIPTADI
ncbi:hypothetical protein F441_07800 [Phytophthora nicotianae CJ01A1]|uniref:MARVEL domain-containing protein n=5 Tax=Phytophthora nicotianae TaxID=4792 RepID=V9F9C8_PHYNI|nr:hypothetical protein F443_07810 [Phytophthora nicotianae P1569]ETK88016.1 hypothetical protein L915_07661 [Phytophthora nicotianae]ETO76800.1 hypothetical protein F444_07877 [Phytophthora nicotianae P1976]ETP17893.1 hypothetical protein F441_07800 [Phytophthora nicotianae CJ01A1]ETP45917.1 hypothetical protein F442_07769 [Phytophthora nicotianae P10297]